MKKILLTMLLMFCVIVANSQNKKSVAVYVEGNVSSTERSIIESKAVSRISMCKEFRTVERNDNFYNTINKEYDFQISGEVSEEDILRFGKKFAAHYVAVFNVTKTDDDYMLMTARLINVENGTIVKSVDSNRAVYSTNDIIALTNNVAYRLVLQK